MKESKIILTQQQVQLVKLHNNFKDNAKILFN